jgi:hypothetical protein
LADPVFVPKCSQDFETFGRKLDSLASQKLHYQPLAREPGSGRRRAEWAIWLYKNDSRRLRKIAEKNTIKGARNLNLILPHRAKIPTARGNGEQEAENDTPENYTHRVRRLRSCADCLLPPIPRLF